MYAASVMLLRRQIEQTVRELVRSSDHKGMPTRLGKVYVATIILRKRKVIGETEAKMISRIYAKASKVVHGNPADRKLCRSLLADWKTAITAIER
jgi:hypothetical protein